jgi:DNA-binding LacI/PurR family transcriptional regulator
VSGIVEIAKMTGVSPATVSRALRGLHHVNEKTRTKIVQAALELNYPLRPDLLPASARTRTNVVAVIAPYISRWYFAQAINGIEQTLRESGIDMMLYNFSQVESRQRVFQEKQLRGKVDAIIVISLPPKDEEIESIFELGIPLTLLGFDYEECNSVMVDDILGGKIATQHLIDYGHKNIAMLSGERDSALSFNVSDHRTKGFLQAISEAGLEWNPENEIRGDYNILTAEIATEAFLGRKGRKLPTAIFCHSDEMALGAMKAIRRKGLRIPEDISVIGFDDHEIAQYVGLTTVSQPPQFLGQMAASATIATIASPEAKMKHLFVATSLIVRETTARI